MKSKNTGLKIDPDSDPTIYRSPWTLMNAGVQYLEGTDLHVHSEPDGLYLYYLCHWTLHDQKRFIEPISRNKAMVFLEEVTGDGNFGHMSFMEVVLAKKHFPELFKE